MSDRPPPLPAGTRLQDRFEIEEPLGQGGYGITYRARDTLRGDVCIVRELAPAGAVRSKEGVLTLARTGEASAQRLRQRFQQEARRLSRISGPALLPVRACFVDLGTAFLAREWSPDALTLSERILREGRMPPAEVDGILAPLSESLHGLHAQGIYHLDIRPSNILLTPKGGAFLIDFGESRKWHQDLFETESEREGLPPELRMRGSRISPEMDVYGLGASLYYALTGMMPALGTENIPMTQACPEASSWLAQAIDRSIRPDPKDRPHSVFALGEIAKGQEKPVPTMDAVKEFDRKALELKQLRFDRRQCPSCGEVLENPKPLRKEGCPVCHEGTIRPRKIVERLCPHCRMGLLKHVPNVEPLGVCPLCAEGLLHKRRKRLFSKEYFHGCENCEAVFEWVSPDFILVVPPEPSDFKPGEARSCQAWRYYCGRSTEIWSCGGCSAQYDRLPDGRWRQQIPAKTGKFDALDPNEWARVAAGLPPEAGNAECDACGADFFVDGEDVALLETRFDPHHFAAHNAGRLLTMEQLRWIGVGKESPNPGLVCVECETEFDLDGDSLSLVRSNNPGLIEHHNESLSLENWHRAGKDLPLAGQEDGFDEAFAVALRTAFIENELPFADRDSNLIWKGPAVRYEIGETGWQPSGEGQLQVQEDEITFGGLVKKQKWDRSEIDQVQSDGSRLILELRDGVPVGLEIEPVRWKVHLDSGPRTIDLTAFDLAARLRAEPKAVAVLASKEV